MSEKRLVRDQAGVSRGHRRWPRRRRVTGHSPGPAARRRLRAAENRVGQAFQFDRSEGGLVVGRVWRRLQVARVKRHAGYAVMRGLPEPGSPSSYSMPAPVPVGGAFLFPLVSNGREHARAMIAGNPAFGEGVGVVGATKMSTVLLDRFTDQRHFIETRATTPTASGTVWPPANRGSRRVSGPSGARLPTTPSGPKIITLVQSPSVNGSAAFPGQDIAGSPDQNSVGVSRRAMA